MAAKFEVIDVAPGLWLWRIVHPHWKRGNDWQPIVTSTVVESGGEVVLIDPLLPPDDATEIWTRLDAKPPTVAVVVIADHIRDIDKVVKRYGARAMGPRLFWRDDIPETELEVVQPDMVLPGGLVALRDERGRLETPLWLPQQRTIVFGDALTERDGVLRVWDSPWHETRALPELRKHLELPFERVIISHGEPVHDRAAYERALVLPGYR
jgi:glyoxylase-like metal-dependent hydrolase (beta-lactamase superfamily II)